MAKNLTIACDSITSIESERYLPSLNVSLEGCEIGDILGQWDVKEVLDELYIEDIISYLESDGYTVSS